MLETYCRWKHARPTNHDCSGFHVASSHFTTMWHNNYFKLEEINENPYYLAEKYSSKRVTMGTSSDKWLPASLSINQYLDKSFTPTLITSFMPACFHHLVGNAVANECLGYSELQRGLWWWWNPSFGELDGFVSYSYRAFAWKETQWYYDCLFSFNTS